MDSNGVYKEINRQVLRAIIFCCSSGEAPKFSDVMEFVSFYNRNSQRNCNLKEMVRKSLSNLWNVGAIKRDEKSGRYFSNNIDYMDLVNIEFILDTNRPKVLKRLLSSDIIEDTRKRHKIDKNLGKKGRKVPLPKSRREKQCSVLNLNNQQNYGKILNTVKKVLPQVESWSNCYRKNTCDQVFGGTLGPNTTNSNHSQSVHGQQASLNDMTDKCDIQN